MTGPEEPRDPIEEFTGDREGAALLRDSLRVLADRYAGHPLGDQVADVLAGRSTMRQLADDPEFASMAHEGMREVQRQWQELSPEERAEYVEHARRTQAERG